MKFSWHWSNPGGWFGIIIKHDGERKEDCKKCNPQEGEK